MFDFLQRKRSWANMDAFEGQETSSGVSLTESGVLAIPAVFSCVKILSESIASLPLLVYERDGKNRNRARSFSLYDLLHRAPNPRMTSFELRELLVGHLCLRGNAFCFIQRDMGEVVALWPLHPDRVTVEADKGVILYRYNGDDEEKIYQADDVLHIKGMGSDGIMGYSPLSLCRDTWGQAKAASEFSGNYFKNDASPGGILSAPGALDPVAHANLKKAWESRHKGRGKKHSVAVLDGGLTWQSIGLSPEDSQMIESMKFSVVEVARIFRVPLNLIGDVDRATYNNILEMNKSFLTHTLRPWLSRIEQGMERVLLTESEKHRYSIEFLTADLLRANTKERFESYKVARETGILSVNEIRAFENLNDIGPEGDSYIPANVTSSQQLEEKVTDKQA